MNQCFVLICLVSVGIAYPAISPEYFSAGNIEIVDPSSKQMVKFEQGESARTQRSVMTLFFSEPETMDSRTLSRYDLKTVYYYSNSMASCDEDKLDLPFTPTFSWLSQSTYKGKQTVHGQYGDVWELKSEGETYTLCLNGQTPLVFVITESPNTYTAMTYTLFAPTVDQSAFTVPQFCP